MRLPEICVSCGADAHGGRRVNGRRDFYPRWVWTGLILPFPPLILLVLCLIGRKTVEISYSVCPACLRARRRRRLSAAGLWVLTAAAMLLSVQFDNAWILVPSAVLFAAALTTSFLGNQPLRAVRYAAGTFTVTGFSERFPGLRVAAGE